MTVTIQPESGLQAAEHDLVIDFNLHRMVSHRRWPLPLPWPPRSHRNRRNRPFVVQPTSQPETRTWMHFRFIIITILFTCPSSIVKIEMAWWCEIMPVFAVFRSTCLVDWLTGFVVSLTNFALTCLSLLVNFNQVEHLTGSQSWMKIPVFVWAQSPRLKWSWSIFD